MGTRRSDKDGHGFDLSDISGKSTDFADEDTNPGTIYARLFQIVRHHPTRFPLDPIKREMLMAFANFWVDHYHHHPLSQSAEKDKYVSLHCAQCGLSLLVHDEQYSAWKLHCMTMGLLWLWPDANESSQECPSSAPWKNHWIISINQHRSWRYKEQHHWVEGSDKPVTSIRMLHVFSPHNIDKGHSQKY